MSGAGRNDPCPCGSGKKYKQCCLRTEEAEKAPKATPAMELHCLDERLADDILGFARRRHGRQWFRDAAAACVGRSEELDDRDLQLLVPWALYHFEVDGRTLAELFLLERGPRLASADRAWIDAQRAAWLSVWEVCEVQPGVGLRMEDLLTGASRFVHEQSGSRVLVHRDAVLGRVVQSGDICVFCGVHARPLPPGPAAAIVREVRDLVREGEGNVTPERLRVPSVERKLLGAWRQACESLDRRPFPQLRNTDGDPLRLTADHYSFPPERRVDIESRIESLIGEPKEEGEGGVTYFTFTRPGNKMHRDWDNTILGRAVVSRDSLCLETNSRRRASNLKKRVERVCGDLIEFCSRTEQDQHSLERSAREQPEPEEETPERNPEMLAITRQFKESHYAAWVDDRIPALGGMTPREAARTEPGRELLDGLLKEIENSEARIPPEERYDIARLRRRLGV